MTTRTLMRAGKARVVAGLPARSITLSHSERMVSTCPLRWWFGYANNLRQPRTRALDLGSAFHAAMADMYGWFSAKDTAYPADGFWRCVWCVNHDDGPCLACKGTRMGPVPRAGLDWAQAANDGSLTTEEAADRLDTLTRICEGYLVRHGRNPLDNIRILGVDVALAAPVVAADSGAAYRPRVPLVEDPDGFRFAKPWDGPDRITWVRWPWYHYGILDAVGADRTTGRLWLIEHKCSSDPLGYLDGLAVDPQLAAYTSLLQHGAGLGLFGEQAKARADAGQDAVAGYLYDVASSSYQYDPQTLKEKPPKKSKAPATADYEEVDDVAGMVSSMKPTPSCAMNRLVPSWRFRRWLADNEIDATLYEDHIRALADRYDDRLYRREWGAVATAERQRFVREVAGAAERHAALRRGVVAGGPSAPDAAAQFPRVPVCRQPGGHCAYRGPCMHDTPEARAGYEEGEGQRWRRADAEIAMVTTDEEQPALPF